MDRDNKWLASLWDVVMTCPRCAHNSAINVAEKKPNSDDCADATAPDNHPDPSLGVFFVNTWRFNRALMVMLRGQAMEMALIKKSKGYIE